jgi:RNAse (barnase) inhibitor barstar
LEIANYDVNKAIHVIGSLSKTIVVIKSKFIVNQTNLYGLLFIIFDLRAKKPFRLRSIISYNPAIFETDLNLHWHEFEKKLYAYRLREGVVPELTQRLENYLEERLKIDKTRDIYSLLSQKGETEDREIEKIFFSFLGEWFRGSDLQIVLKREELDLTQFRHIHFDDKEHENVKGMGHVPPGNVVTLQIELVRSEEGKRSENLTSGDIVYASVVDNRDIAQYLAHLLGAKVKEEIVPLPTLVEFVERRGDRVFVSTRFSRGIIGEVLLPFGEKVKAEREKSKESFWEKFKFWLKR